MENLNIYESIWERTQGDIYVGIVGPVRTGKSTFIKRFMDLLVVPNIDNTYIKARLQDELPQSGSGKTITTTEPKFIPAESVPFQLEGNMNFKMRMVDCVGYMVPGALGHTEEGKARMVSTPWSANKIPFEEAAEVGTRKVIREHSTMGIAVTTDGSIGEIHREAYMGAEERVINEMLELKKPFVVLVNSVDPTGESAVEAVKEIKSKFNVPVRAVNCARMSEAEVKEILTDTLMQFPASQINFYFPGFVEGLTSEHWIKAAIISGIKNWIRELDNIDQVKQSIAVLEDGDIISGITISNMNLGTGDIDVQVEMVGGLFYQVVEEMMEQPVKNDYEFFELLKEFATSKKAYDKLKDAMEQVEKDGYGIVQPKLTEMVLDEPEIFKQGNKYGVCLRAKAPSLHIVKTNISTEISPIVGTEKQSEDLVKYLLSEFESDPLKIWDTNIFGKSLQEMVTEQMENKLSNVPGHIRGKVQRSLQKISDEGKDYFICIII